MDIQEYPSNSKKLKEASLVRGEPRAARDTSPTEGANKEGAAKERPAGLVRTREVSTFKKVFAALFPEGFAGIKERIIWDMFVPRMQDFLHSSWEDIGDAVFSDGRPRKSTSHVSYDRMYQADRSTNRRSRSISRAAYDYEEAVFSNRSEAERLERVLKDILRNHHVVTLLDYNEEVGYQTYPEQRYYGWINLDTARIERTFDGYVLVMPRPVEIDIRN